MANIDVNTNDKDFDKFLNEFNIVDNALDMRTLQRWNGRDLRKSENLAEHTHLVVACAIELCDILKEKYNFIVQDGLAILRRCMLHDSLELLRGDILSITKDKIPGLRKFTDDEEVTFLEFTKYSLPFTDSDIAEEICKLADLMACYKFVERELRYPNNDFAREAYIQTKKKFDTYFEDFLKKHNLYTEDVNEVTTRFVKGYALDAGIDVVLNNPVTFMPMCTTVIDLGVKCTNAECHTSVLCARTSAAAKGLSVAMCPIDTDYNGTIKAIVHNLSNNIIHYSAGESFCQLVTFPIVYDVARSLDSTIKIKKEGRRTDGSLGSTGK